MERLGHDRRVILGTNGMHRQVLGLIFALWLVPHAVANARERWTTAEARDWFDRQPWIVGVNYQSPASAVNTLEMWQAETFDPARIDKEFGWAERAGINSLRVWLHHLVWEKDAAGYKQRIARFLELADKHKMRVVFVLFDSCFDPDPHLGPQDPPIPGVPLSRWVQGPGRDRLEDSSQYFKLEQYVKDIVGTFSRDTRVFAWDVWNEPAEEIPPTITAPTPGSASATLNMEGRESKDKVTLTRALLARVFNWARAVDPMQPLTSGLWDPDLSWLPGKLTSTENLQVQQSDILSFHSYLAASAFARSAKLMLGHGRPVICTEWLSRPYGSKFESILPLGKKLNIGMISTGFVDGRLQMKYSFENWEKPYDAEPSEPSLWNFDLLHSDGTPYRPIEIRIIRRLVGKATGHNGGVHIPIDGDRVFQRNVNAESSGT